MEKRRCNKCGVRKEVTEFHRHPRGRGGRRGRCKTCRCAEQREYMKGPGRKERMRRYLREYARRPEAKANGAVRSREWAQANPEKRRAQDAVARALKSGRIKRRPCALCGAKRTHGHHPDYSKPLEVIWLCARHHIELHYLERHKAA